MDPNPQAVPAPALQGGPAESRWAQPSFTVREKRLTLGRQYQVLDAQGRLMAFCRQKMFRLKEDIRFYADEGESQELFRIRARTVMDFKASMDVLDPAGNRIGSVRRKGWKSLLKDEFLILDAREARIGSLHEEGGFLSFVRRWVNLGSLVPATYSLRAGPEGAERHVGTVQERFQVWGDTYDVQWDPRAPIDGRLVVAAVVLSDALGVGNKGN